MKTGLKLAAQKVYHVKGIGIDTWGVDFGPVSYTHLKGAISFVS